MQISMYAVQHACRSIFLTTGKELVCCTFDVADRPGVRDLPSAMPCALMSISCFSGYVHSQCCRRTSRMVLMATMAVRPTSSAAPQGGPKKLVVSLSDAVSCSSTDPTMGQAMLYFTKVQSHTRAHLKILLLLPAAMA